MPWSDLWSAAPVNAGRELARTWLAERDRLRSRPGVRAAKLQEAPLRQLELALRNRSVAERPAWIAKSRSANAFKWALLDAGVEKEDADALTEWLLVRL